MLYRISFILFIGIILFETRIANAQSSPGEENNPTKILGTAMNYLQPCLLIEREGSDWNVEINYIAQTNFLKHAWLKTTNHIGSTLQLWLTNGTEIVSTNPAVLAAMRPAYQTTVSSILSSVHPSDRRGLQWLWTKPGMLSGVTAFNLESVFDRPFTNDVVLQITPLLYKVETDEITVDLVKFPPIKINLMANGNVQEPEE